MKKILLSLLICFLGVYVFGQTQRMVLLEEFTNASCGPCAQQNPEYNQLIHDNADKVVAIKFQTPGPGYDPHYYEVPADVQNIITQRAGLYNVSGVPTGTIDGLVPDDSYAGGVGRWDQAYTGAPFGVNQAVIDFAAAIMSPFSLNLDFTVDESVTPNVLTATVQIVNMMPDTMEVDGHVLQVMMIEEENIFPVAPGTNGELEFEDIFRGMVNGQTGTMLTGKIASGEMAEFEFMVDMPDYIYSKAQLGMAAFIQNTTTNAVVQAGKAASKDFPNDPEASIAGNIMVADNNCDYTSSASATITNLNSVEITTATVALIDADGNIITSTDYMGALAMGESTDVTFDNFSVSPGTSSYSVAIVNVNGQNGDLNTLNNLTTPITVTKWQDDPAFTNELLFDFESVNPTESPANTYLVKPLSYVLGVATTQWLTDILNGSPYPLNGPAGANGSSDGSIIVDFWRWDTRVFDPVGSFSIDKIDLSDRENTTLSFDVNHAPYDANTSDQVEVLISTDCGETGTVVYSKAGAELATSAATTDFYTPRPADWRNETIDLSAYDGMGEVNVIFRFTSAWGNNVFLDNINVTSDPISSNEEIEGLTSLDLFPNPAVQTTNLKLVLENAVNADITISDITGRVVKNVANNVPFTAGVNNYAIGTSELRSGLYFVNIQTENGKSVQKLNIIK